MTVSYAPDHKERHEHKQRKEMSRKDDDSLTQHHLSTVTETCFEIVDGARVRDSSAKWNSVCGFDLVSASHCVAFMIGWTLSASRVH